MSRTLVIIRHAKAEPYGIVASDYERTLVPRGVQGARLTASGLAGLKLHFDMMLASAAPRALFTMKIVASGTGHDPESVVADRSLYSAGGYDMLKTVQAFPDEYETVAVCGHNPAVSELASALSNGTFPYGFHPADAIVLAFAAEKWSDVGNTVYGELLKRISTQLGRAGE